VILPVDPASPVRYVVRPGLQGQQIESIVSAVVDREANRLRAAGFVAAETGVDAATAQSKVDALAAVLPPVPVTVAQVGSTSASTGRFDAMASSQLLLFVFLTALTTSVALIESRRLGVTRRMLATPTSAGTIVRGEALARVSMTLLQAAIIMAGSALLFQVNWGDPLGAGLLVIAFALVASAVGLLLGTLARSSEMAIGTGLLLALGMAALGGAMMPLELFSPTLRKVAHVTPHAWAADGFSTLITHGGGVSGILPELGVLLGAAAVLFTVGAWLLRRRLAR
jgi:ABC-2 type transport system permease protein